MSANAIETLRRYYALNDREYRDALDAVEALLEAAKDAAEMCWRCHSKASSETRSERHGQEWCNVCWDRVQPAPVVLAAAVLRVETGQ